jgi:DNA-binding SARP family transcriptional activator
MRETSTHASPKITRPRLHGVVSRERLFHRIADFTSPIVWMAAPPGAGKTTLVASFVEGRRLSTIWYQLDSSDRDPATFFHYLARAVSHSGLSRRKTLPALPTEPSADLAAFARRYFRELFEQLPDVAVLVLDNYQDAADPLLDGVLREAFEQVPDGIKVIVASLSDPPQTLARLVANRVISVMDAEELLFTWDEARQILSPRVAMDDETLRALHERSGGWAAGLVLMSEHARRLGRRDIASLTESPAAVFDYFAGEIFVHARPEHQRVLMLAALLPRITAKAAEAASGCRDADRVLEQLYRRHLFIDRRQGSEIVYQFHGLFRSFLQARGRDCLSREERAQAAMRVATLLEADGHLEEAVGLYLDAGQPALATRLILQQAPTLYEQGRWRTLLDWITALPPDVHEATPWLAYWVGACEVWIDPPTARVRLEEAFRAFAASDDPAGQTLAAGALSRACILDADWSALDKWISALEQLCEHDADALAPQIRLIGLSRLLYATFARQPRHPCLAEWAERTVALLGTSADGNEVILAAFSLMMYYNWTGVTSRQEEIVRRIKPLLAKPELLSSVSLTYWKWVYSGYLLRVGTPRESLAVIDEALELARNSGLTIAMVIRRHRLAPLLTMLDLSAAEVEIKALDPAPHVEPYYEMKSWLGLQRGNLTLAEQDAHTALQLAVDRGRTYYLILDHLLLATVRAEAGQHDGALSHIAIYREQTSGIDGPLHEYQASLVEAYVALQQDNSTRCHERLRAALQIGQDQRYRTHGSWCRRMMARLYAEALRQDIAAGYVQDVIRQLELTPESPDIESWPWPIRIYAMGQFEVMKDGELLRFEGKAQRKPMGLAKVLVALGEGGARIEQLVDILWPEPSKGDGQKALDITIHRLRALLGSDDALQVNNRRVSFNPKQVWVDLWALERALAPLIPAVNAVEPDIAQLEAAAPQVLKVYRGHFLAGEKEEPWQLPVRNRLSGRFQRFAIRLGEHWEAKGAWSRAAELYARVIELDPLAETFYRRQMKCLHRQRRRPEALEVFRRCRHTLSVVLGVKPADETDALYRQLLDG